MEEQDDKKPADEASKFVGRCLIKVALWGVLGPVLGEVGDAV